MAREIFQQLLQAVAFIHSQNVLHCDIKATNVLLRPNARHALGHAVLSDFGCWTAAGTRRADHQCGSSRYMAPEVVGDFELATVASDVYSFGLLLWELSYVRVAMQRFNHIQVALLRCSGDAGATPTWGRVLPVRGTRAQHGRGSRRQ